VHLIFLFISPLSFCLSKSCSFQNSGQLYVLFMQLQAVEIIH
jgi:hypothetical protein